MERERFRRFLVVVIFTIAFILFLGVFLMFPAYLSLAVERKNLTQEVQLSRQAAPLAELENLEKQIQNFNSKILVLENSFSKNISISEIFEKIISMSPARLTLDGLAFRRTSLSDPGRIILNGRAPAREELLNFVKALEESKLFKKIDSPVSNLLKRTEIQFSLELTLGQP